MTAPQADGADRFSRDAGRPLGASAAAPALVILLLLGLLLRLTIAYVLLPGSGFETDIATYSYWANRLYELGPGQFYEAGIFADYPPGYLYVLWIGTRIVAPLAGGDLSLVSADLLKLPSILADIGIGFVLYRLVRGWLADRPDAGRLGLLAAAIYVFNPITWYDSAVWGQTDAIGSLVVLLGVAALVRGNSEGASLMAVLALLVKPQFGVVLGPLVAVVLLRRHLLAPGSNPRHRAWLPEPLRSWFEEEQGLVRLVSSAVAGLILLLVMITPFNLSVPAFIERIAGAAGGYAWLSVNAYNPWALVGSGGQQPIALGGPWSSDTVPLLGPLPGVVIGAGLLVAGFLIGVLRLAWRVDRRSIIVVAVFLSLCFFVLPTRVHERYLFPVFALLPLLAVVDRRWLAVLVGLSVAAFINFHGILTTPLYATPNLEGMPLGAWFREPGPIAVSVALATAGFLYTLGRLRPRAADETDPYSATEAARGGWTPDDEAEGDDPGAAWPTDRQPKAASLFAPLREALGSLVAVVPLRRDRSPELASETGGRLDRLDLLLLVLLLLATLGLRTFRLEKPYGMHFDEVYHARTATEFLQHWRYGMPHSIYEYTHPHLAKYVMAAGITVFGNNRVVAEADLALPVTDAAAERRWAPEATPSVHNGDRLYVATGTDVRVLELASRTPVATILAPATRVAVDEDGHRLFMADAAGALWQLPTAELDALRGAATPGDLAARPLTTLDGLAGELRWLGVTGSRLVVISSGGTVVSLDPSTGSETGRTTLGGAVEAVGVSGGDRLVVEPALLADIPAAASALAEAVGGDAAQFEELLARPAGRVTLAGYLDEGQSEAVQAAIDDGPLTGASVDSGSALAVAAADGVVIIDAETLDELASFATSEPVTGLALVERGTDRPTIYAAAGAGLERVRMEQDGPPVHDQPIEMPNTVSDALWNPSTSLLHAPGISQDGTAPTVYVLSPVSNSIFADAALSAEPVAIVLDAQPRRPADERADLLAFGADGVVEIVDTGNNAFAWRLPGVVAGALMAACLYLLGRFLFRRRSVAVFAGLMVLADGMFFANARIAMNDTYVALFITAAMTLFAPLWLGRWRARWAVALGLLGVGLLLGLALASKWVAAYAIGGVGLLILLRSALGRLIALAAMIGLTGFLGYLAITPAADADGAQLNFLFLLLMLGLTVALAVLISLRPVRMTLDELRLMVAGPIAAGVIALVAGGAMLALAPDVPGGATAGIGPLTPGRLLIAGGAGIALGGLGYGIARLGRRFGWGPLARPVPAAPGTEPAGPPPPRGWLRPGSGLLGLPWFGALAAITLIPLAVYIVSFVPWIELGNRWLPNLPAGNTGQLFLDLQVSMYDYHNNLRATHAASSPWWAWPFDLKPVWFYKEDFAGGTMAQIYDAGNLVLFWLAIPAFAFATYQAWRRRSLPLTLIVVGVCCLWLPWARIDRVAFQYHIFTSLPFWFLGLAYFLAELWHGPSARTWLLARVAAALAIIGPAVLWLLRLPLCAIGGTQSVNPGTEVCAVLSRNLVLTDMQALGLLSAAAAVLLVGWLLWLGSDSGAPAEGRSRLLLPVVFALAVGGAGLAVLGAALPGRPIFEHDVHAEEPAFAALLLLSIPAYLVLRARDARRFVVGALAAAGIWFVVWYPNIAALPVPSAIAQVYQGLLPTWNYAFQFGSNQDAPNRGGIELLNVAVLGVMSTLLVAAAIYVARAWRAERAERRLFRALREAG